MRKARELTIILLLALGALLIGGILFEQLHRVFILTFMQPL